MENEAVVIEVLNIEEQEVIVYPFDRDNHIVTGGPIETTTRWEASEAYDVVGEIFSGNIRLYKFAPGRNAPPIKKTIALI